jgi:hypothetical protein
VLHKVLPLAIFDPSDLDFAPMSMAEQSYSGLQEVLEELSQRSVDLVKYRSSLSLDLVLVYSRRWAAYRE